MNPAIFLDFDGVLIDSLDLYLNVFKNLCHEHGKELPIHDADAFRAWYHADWKINFEQLGFDDQQYLDICTAYPQTLDYTHSVFFEGIPELIRTFAADHPLLIVSTAPTANITYCLKKADLFDHFVAVTGSDDGSTAKTGRLEALIKRYGYEKGVMVGDTDLDIVAGKANGLVTVACAYGWHGEERLRVVEPDFICSHPEELGEVLGKALGACLP